NGYSVYSICDGGMYFVLYGNITGKDPWLLVIIAVLVFAVIYYYLFRFFIKKFNLNTTGREKVEEDEETQGNAGDLAYNVLEAMGGQENISHLDACITRLRVSVNDIKNVDKKELEKLGAAGVLEVGNNIQAIFGPRSEIIKGQMQDIVSGKTPRAAEAIKEEPVTDTNVQG